MSTKKPMHGMTKALGCEHARLGNFCKLFPKLPTWAKSCSIEDQCEAEEMAEVLGGPGGIMHDADGSSPDSCIPAAYTFFAQFVDHDITLDTTTKLHGSELPREKIERLPNLRSPSLDLDCVYGLGPDAMPFMYDQSQPGRMLIGHDKNEDDVPRNQDGRALIGDPRNDENIFVSQMQLLFLRFHNRRIIGRSFEEAQTDVRYHYQWLVLYDFLRRISDPKIYDTVLPLLENKDGAFPVCDLRDKCDRICMPVEFSVAAYRFGHTLVRSQYPVNADYPVVELFDERFGTLGFGRVPKKLVVDWRFLLDVASCQEFVKSKAIDHLLADELIRMPDPIVGRSATANDRSLAFRNLLRGYVLGLPSGQVLAAELANKAPYSACIDPNARLPFDEIAGWACLPKKWRKCLEEHTPLFLYMMLEGTANGGRHLGPVGSAVLLEVFGNMFRHCHTFLHATVEPDPCTEKERKKPKAQRWQPDPCIWDADGNGGDPKKDFTLADLVHYV